MKRFQPGLILPCSLLLLATQTAIASASQAWNFNVYLDDKVIGQHRFEVFTRDKTRYVAVDASFDVRVLFINAYRYRHDNYEVWQGKCLQTIRSHTDDNGDKTFVDGTIQDGILQLRTIDGTETLPGCIRTFAYWDPVILKSKYLLNAQTGKLLPVQVNALGEEQIQVRGKQVSAYHYRLVTDKFVIDLWYSPQREWLALQSTTSSGAVLRYQLQ